MTQYIDKSALVAEIDRRIKVLQKHPYENHKTICHLESLKQSLDTLEVKEIGVDLGDPKGDKSAKYIIDTKNLEVKEVDLEKEFDNYAKDILACDVQFEPFTHLYNCAKYFYELGLAQKGE